MYRQGDILIIPVDPEIDWIDAERAKRVPRDRLRVVLAYGEATGHAHAIASLGATLYEQDDERFLHLRLPATLRHEEHARIKLPAGKYRVVQQVEYPDVIVLD